MKKILLVLILIVSCCFIAGCRPSENTAVDVSSDNVLVPIKVGATPAPHAQILEAAKDILAQRGYDLQIIEFVDYVQPNLALNNYELDANYFQHTPYLDNFNTNHGVNLVSAGSIHYEPFGLFPGKTKTLEALSNGATIAVPNDTTNEARALLLLESLGYITIREGAGLEATIADIVANPKNLKIVELEAAQIPRSLEDVDVAVINGNYAIQAGLNASSDALAIEDKDSLAAVTFANIVAVRSGDENSDSIEDLISVLTGEEIRYFIESTYEGAVVPVF